MKYNCINTRIVFALYNYYRHNHEKINGKKQCKIEYNHK